MGAVARWRSSADGIWSASRLRDPRGARATRLRQRRRALPAPLYLLHHGESVLSGVPRRLDGPGAAAGAAEFGHVGQAADVLLAVERTSARPALDRDPVSGHRIRRCGLRPPRLRGSWWAPGSRRWRLRRWSHTRWARRSVSTSPTSTFPPPASRLSASRCSSGRHVRQRASRLGGRGRHQLAALTREILVYVAVLALITALFEPAGRRLRAALPWLVSLAVFAAGYAAHVAEVRSMVVPASSAITYWKGSPSFVANSFARFTNVLAGNGYLLAVLFALAAIGAVASAKRAGRSFAVFSATLLVGPLIVMLKVGNPAIDAMGNQVNYWGNLFMPFALALWPTWQLALPEADRAAQPAAEQTATHDL